MRFLLDVESTSTVDLRAAGADAYWQHRDTQVICVCYRLGNGPIETWCPGDPVPQAVLALGPDDRVVAHNYLFEYACWTYRLQDYDWPLPPLGRWDCTMARALFWGLPQGLGAACDALGLTIGKDTAMRPLMLRMARPRSIEPAITWWHETDAEKRSQLLAYCAQDVWAECALDDHLPSLPARERAVWLADGRMNLRGVAIDVPLVGRLAAITKAEQVRLNHRLAEATGGAATGTAQVARIRGWLQRLGLPLDDLTHETVRTALRERSQGDAAYRVLEIRRQAAKASTAKLKALLHGVSPDGRCRGLFQYCGAARTGRWAGRRFQPQNLPRTTLPHIESMFGLVQAGADLAAIDALSPVPVLDAVSVMLRGCLVARPGRMFVAGDLAQIEARVVAWLAGQDDILDVFSQGQDVYQYTATKVGSPSRQLGKVIVLACNYSMGPDRFQETAATYGLTLSLEEARQAVWAYRDANPAIVRFWHDLEEVVRVVAEGAHGSTLRVGWIEVQKWRRALRLILPSGHVLTYHDITLEKEDAFSEPGLFYQGVNPKTKRWDKIRTYGGRLVENVTQAVARDVMADALIERDRNNGCIVGTFHDELLEEVDADAADEGLATLLATLSRFRPWAPGLPIAAAGWTGHRYRKA